MAISTDWERSVKSLGKSYRAELNDKESIKEMFIQVSNMGTVDAEVSEYTRQELHQTWIVFFQATPLCTVSVFIFLFMWVMVSFTKSLDFMFPTSWPRQTDCHSSTGLFLAF